MDLGKLALRGLLNRNPELDPKDVDYLLFGTVIQVQSTGGRRRQSGTHFHSVHLSYSTMYMPRHAREIDNKRSPHMQQRQFYRVSFWPMTAACVRLWGVHEIMADT